MALDDLLVGVDQVAQQLGRHLGVRGGAGQLLGRVEEGVELLARELEHDPAVHGDEAAVRVEGEALVAGLLGQALDRAVVEPEVQDGVHHAGHGELGARAHRDQRGSSASPITLPMAASRRVRASATSASRLLGHPPAM